MNEKGSQGSLFVASYWDCRALRGVGRITAERLSAISARYRRMTPLASCALRSYRTSRCPWRRANNRRAVIRHFGGVSADDAVGVIRPTELSGSCVAGPQIHRMKASTRAKKPHFCR
ncbi:hypothetical protein IPC1338_22580 [Pseudomonas aeruginosa]|nr:hypothetical protein IPC1338_22580 [Pseudomonas aeruginosa]